MQSHNKEQIKLSWQQRQLGILRRVGVTAGLSFQEFRTGCVAFFAAAGADVFLFNREVHAFGVAAFDGVEADVGTRRFAGGAV